MNYRHGYHAGNFADVVKHAILARIITYLKQKPQPFRVIDTHAGQGRYDLTSPEADKTGEWRDGIDRIYNADLPAAVADLLAPYLDSIRALNDDGELRFYPGSALIARMLMRREDALVANELEPSAFASLKEEFKRSKNTTALNIDARFAVKSLLPPKERRGLVVIDPPFEDRSEFTNLAAAVEDGLSRFATGTYLIWYPVKDTAAADGFVSAATARPGSKFLDVRLRVCAPFPGLGLTETGVLVLHPPYVLRQELEIILPVLAAALAEGDGSAFTLTDIGR